MKTKIDKNCGCHEYAECIDAFDVQTCACLPGFTGDGYECVEIL